MVPTSHCIKLSFGIQTIVNYSKLLQVPQKLLYSYLVVTVYKDLLKLLWVR